MKDFKDKPLNHVSEGSPLAFTKEVNQIKLLLINMGLNEYQASTLAHLILIGEAKATTISKISGVPSARIYEVLNELAKIGLVSKKPGRPIIYKPLPPEDISSSLISSNVSEFKQKLQHLEGFAKELVEASEKIYLKGMRGTLPTPLLRIVRVGEISLNETKKLYNTAKNEILILSRAMEYLPEVADSLKKAFSRGVSARIILMNPKLLRPSDRKIQSDIFEQIKNLGADTEIRFADEVPIRGCVIDPNNEGKALFLVEDPGVPYFLREAAITTHPSIVRGLALMFRLMWEHETKFSEAGLPQNHKMQ